MERIESKNLESLIANSTYNLAASFHHHALRMPPPENHQDRSAAFFSTDRSAASMFPGDQNHCLNPYGHVVNENPSFSDTLYESYPFESEFGRLSLSSPRPGYVAPPTPHVPAGRGSGGYNSSADHYMSNGIGFPSYGAHPKLSSNGEIELMRNRVQSAARVHNQRQFYLPSVNHNFDSYDHDPFVDYVPAPRRNQNGYGVFPGDQNEFLYYQRDMNQCSNGSNNLLRQRWSFSSLEDLKGKFFMAAKDQAGCRFLQQKCEERNLEDIHMIFMEIKDHTLELMMDQFGNYMVQKLFEVCNQEQMSELLMVVTKDVRNFTAVCLDTHGTRAVQKMMDYLTTHDQRSHLISMLWHMTVTLTKSMNGHHVIEHCLENFPIEYNRHILNIIAENCLEIATDKSGCCVLQKCVHHAKGESHDRLVAEITSNALVLSEHPYGNYVVQYLLGMRVPHVTAHIMAQLSGHYVSLSMNKYGSNVVEKCIKNSQGDRALTVIQEIIRSPKFVMVLQDAYGNYVVQSALLMTRGAARGEIVDLVFANYAFLHSHPYGKRVLASCKSYKMRSMNA